MANCLLSVALLFVEPSAPLAAATPATLATPTEQPPAPTVSTAEPVFAPLMVEAPPRTIAQPEVQPQQREAPTPPANRADPPAEPHPSDALLAALRMCESSNRYSINTGNGYRGAYQYLQSTWNHAARINGRPDLVGVPVEHVAPADQDAITRAWWTQSDYRQQWPVCSLVAIASAR